LSDDKKVRHTSAIIIVVICITTGNSEAKGFQKNLLDF